MFVLYGLQIAVITRGLRVAVIHTLYLVSLSPSLSSGYYLDRGIRLCGHLLRIYQTHGLSDFFDFFEVSMCVRVWSFVI